MRTKSLSFIPILLALAVALPLAGCGDGNNDDIFIDVNTPTPSDGHTPTPVRTSTPPPGSTATATIAAPVATPTETVAGGPTTTPTPVAGGCTAGDQIVVAASFSKPYGAGRIDLLYPASVNIPGTGTNASVVARVAFAASGGLTTVNDSPVNSAVDDTLTASFVGFTENAAGTFVTVTFDCVEGQAPPTAAGFTCTVVSASTPGGVSIPDETCTLQVTGP
jgi:hypothetical protein